MRRALLWNLCWVSSLALANPPSPARPQYRLTYFAEEAARCPVREDWISAFNAKAGYRLIEAHAPHLLAVQVRVEGGQLQALTELQEGKERFERAFSAGLGECQALMETVALATSLELQPTPPLAPPKPAPPVVAISAPVPISPPASTSPHWRVGFGAGVGTQASPSWSVQASGGLRLAALGLDLEARAQPWRSQTLGAGLSLQGRSFSLAAVPCYRVRPVELCLEVEAGVERWEVEGAVAGTWVFHPTVNSGARVAGFVPLAPSVELGGALRAGWSWSRARLWVDEAIVHRTAPWYGGLDVVLRYQLGDRTR